MVNEESYEDLHQILRTGPIRIIGIIRTIRIFIGFGDNSSSRILSKSFEFQRDGWTEMIIIIQVACQVGQDQEIGSRCCYCCG